MLTIKELQDIREKIANHPSARVYDLYKRAEPYGGLTPKTLIDEYQSLSCREQGQYQLLNAARYITAAIALLSDPS